MIHSGTSTTVWAALIGNLLVALTKIAAALWSGSSALLSEAVHSVVDTGNEGLLLYGMRRSRQRPDAEHPFGFGRELYFWSFIVALFLFGLPRSTVSDRSGLGDVSQFTLACSAERPKERRYASADVRQRQRCMRPFNPSVDVLGYAHACTRCRQFRSRQN